MLLLRKMYSCLRPLSECVYERYSCHSGDKLAVRKMRTFVSEEHSPAILAKPPEYFSISQRIMHVTLIRSVPRYSTTLKIHDDITKESRNGLRSLGARAKYYTVDKND